MLDKVKQIGFQMHEIMDGTHNFVNASGPSGEFPLYFEIDWGADSLVDFLNPGLGEEVFMNNKCEGTITVGELVEDAPCTGTLELRYFTEQKLRYTLDFKGNDGTEYRYIGEKVNLRPWNLHRTHTTCYGTVYEMPSEKEISKSIVYFRFSTIPQFMSSFRLLF